MANDAANGYEDVNDSLISNFRTIDIYTLPTLFYNNSIDTQKVNYDFCKTVQ